MGRCGALSEPTTCLYTFFLPCYAVKTAAEDLYVDDDTARLYCVATCCGLGCCVFAQLGVEVAEKRGIDDMTLTRSLLLASGLPCSCCYPCQVVHEAKLSNEATALSPQHMERLTELWEEDQIFDTTLD